MLARNKNWDGFNNRHDVGHLVRWTSKGEFQTKLPQTETTITLPKWGTVKKSVLVALHGKDSQVPIFLWKFLNTIPLDGDEKNISLENLIWSGSSSNLCFTDMPGYRFIPGFSRYVINRKGKVFSIVSKRYLSPYLAEIGYWMYGLQPDIGPRRITPLHRILALTFIPYGADVNKLDVNHKDGNKENNSLGNLEWSTRSQNCIHAYSTGLREDNKSILVRDIRTNEIQKFFSMAEASRTLGINRPTISLRMKNGPNKTYYPGLQFKFSSDTREWPEIKDIEAEIQDSYQKKRILFKDLRNGEEKIFNSFSECSRYTGINRASVTWRITNRNGIPVNGVILKALPLDLEF